MQVSSTFWTSKTLWFAAAPAIVTTLAAVSTGRLTWDQALLAIFAALGALFVRDRIDINDDSQHVRHQRLLEAIEDNTQAIEDHDGNEGTRHINRMDAILGEALNLEPDEPEDGEADKPTPAP